MNQYLLRRETVDKETGISEHMDKENVGVSDRRA